MGEMAYSAIFPITNMIKQVYLILAALMLLCLAPMPHGYFQLVRFVAMAALWNLLPKRFVFPSSGTPHSGGINNRVFGEQSLDVLCESVRRIDSVEPVGDVTEMGVELVTIDLAVDYPWIRQIVGNVWLYHDVDVPETSVMGTDITNNSNATQPVTHVLKLGNHETSANRFLGSVIAHVTVKFGKRSHRGHLHCLPNWGHGGTVIFPKVLQDIFIFRTVEFILQTLEVTCEQSAATCQRRVHKPECSMPFCKQTNHSGTDGDFNLLDRREEKKSQFLIKMIEANNLRKLGTRFEYVSHLICFHQSPVASQTKIANGIKNIFGFSIVIYLKPSLFQNINLLLEREQLLGVFHNSINKKWPALVRYIPCGREAVAGSIGCKVTTFNRNFQRIWQKSA